MAWHPWNWLSSGTMQESGRTCEGSWQHLTSMSNASLLIRAWPGECQPEEPSDDDHLDRLSWGVRLGSQQMRQPRTGKVLTGRQPDCWIRACYMCPTTHVYRMALQRLSHLLKCGRASSHCSAQPNRDHKK